MDIPEHIFRSYDIRGKLNEVKPEIARSVASSAVIAEGAKKVIVGRDMRSTSEALAAAAIEGAVFAGADVLDIGLTTTSMWNFAVTSTPGVDLGIMITASHNPADYNGMKVSRASGMPISGKQMLAMVKEAPSVEAARGSVSSYSVIEPYLKKCLSLASVPDMSGVKIVVDYGNGMGVVSVRELLKRVGVEAVELFPEPDATFPNHEANPAIEKNLAALKEAVVREGAALGIALDGDVDRMKIVDEKGATVATDHSHALLMGDLIRRAGGGKAVLTMNMSWATHDAVREAGGEILECPIGRTNVIAMMLEEGALIGGEVSGHIMFKDFASLEAIDFAILQFLALWKASGKSCSELVAPLRATYGNSGEVNVEVENKDAVIKAVRASYEPQATETSTKDGVRCVFGRDWWFIIRPSNTEPVIRLTVEAMSLSAMEAKRDEILALMKSAGMPGSTT